MNNPQNLEEWKAYIAPLSGVYLRDQAIGANTLVFVRTLQEEGFSGSDILDILKMFLFRLLEDEQVLPNGIPGEYLSYPGLLLSIQQDEAV